MGIQNTDFQIAMVAGKMRLAAEEQDFTAEPHPMPSYLQHENEREHLAAAAIFTGVSLMSAVTFVAGLAAISSGAPAPWSHGLIALSIGQIAIVGGASLKIYSLMEKNRKLLTKFSDTAAPSWSEQRRKPVITIAPPSTSYETYDDSARGYLGDREYIMFSDGSIEIDTLLGRRRFTSLDAAREFVGE